MAVEKLVFVQQHRARQLRGARKRDASRAGRADLPEELLDAMQRAAPLGNRVSWDALERTLKEEREAREQPQAQRASPPMEKLARGWVLQVPRDAQQVQQEREQQELRQELVSGQQGPRQGGLPGDALQLDEPPQERGLPGEVRQARVPPERRLREYQVLRELRLDDAVRVAVTRLWLPLPSPRVPRRRPLLRLRHPSNGGGLVRQLQR